MPFGPQREAGEPESTYYSRMAAFCWRWTFCSAPAFALTIYALLQGLGDGLLWKGTVFAMLLAGFALGMSVFASIGFSIGTGLAHICEAGAKTAKGMERAFFVLASLLILPVWIFAGYQLLNAILWQEIIATDRHTGSRWATLQDEPVLFLFALTIFTISFAALPPLWMQSARATFTRRTRTGTALDIAPGAHAPYRLRERRETPRIGKDT